MKMMELHEMTVQWLFHYIRQISIHRQCPTNARLGSQVYSKSGNFQSPLHIRKIRLTSCQMFNNDVNAIQFSKNEASLVHRPDYKVISRLALVIICDKWKLISKKRKSFTPHIANRYCSLQNIISKIIHTIEN